MKKLRPSFVTVEVNVGHVDVEVDLGDIDTDDLRAELNRRHKIGDDGEARADIRNEDALSKALYYARRDPALAAFYLACANPDFEPLRAIVERASH